MFNLFRPKEHEKNIELIPSYNSLVTTIEYSELKTYRQNGQLIDLNNAVATGLCKIVEKLPDVVARKGMSGLYKLDMKGINGTLMTLKSGGNTTDIVGESGKIIGKSSITAVGTTAPQLLANVMNVASVATGMYYMNAITNKLEQAERLLNGVRQFLEDEKKSEMLAIYGELKKIYEDYQFCISDEEYNGNLLCTNRAMLSSIEQKLDSNIEFYLLQLQHNHTKFKERDKSKVIGETINNLCEYINVLKQLYNLYCIKTVLEINYADKSNIMNEAYVESRKKLLLSKHETINEELKKQAEIRTYFLNEKFTLIDNIKKMNILKALKDSEESIWHKGIETIKRAKNNRKTQIIIDANVKFDEVENVIDGFAIEEPLNYTEMIDNIVMVARDIPDLILDNGKVYLLKN